MRTRALTPLVPSPPLRHPADYAAAYSTALSLASKGADLVDSAKTRDSTLQQMLVYAKRVGLDMAALPPIIHVAGTKGKGSTCVMTEAVLRAHGLRTGLFTSPHLCNMRERFRINGRPAPEPVFLKYFWHVWDALKAGAARHEAGDAAETEAEAVTVRPMPPFFRFLTLLCLHMFCEEPVDVLILEVGLGGRLDATNIIEKPVVTAVTTLDLDHVLVLGNTLAEIAAEKAGIFKPGVPAVTCAQEESAMGVLKRTAADVGAPLVVALPGDIESRWAATLAGTTAATALDSDARFPPMGMHGAFQRVNAALAIALADQFLSATGRVEGVAATQTPWGGVAGADTTDGVGARASREWAALPLPAKHLQGLAAASWPGRAQILRMAERGPKGSRLHRDTLRRERALSGGVPDTVSGGDWPDSATSGAVGAGAGASDDPTAGADRSGRSGGPRPASPGSGTPEGPATHGVPPTVTFFIDGAHTERSMDACASWFVSASTAEAGRHPSTKVKRVLLFNCGHEKSPLTLLHPLRLVCEGADGLGKHDGDDRGFESVLFCPFDYSRPSRYVPPTAKEVVDAYFAVHDRRSGSADAADPLSALGALTVSAAPELVGIVTETGGGESAASGASNSAPIESPEDSAPPALRWQHTLKSLWSTLGSDARFGLTPAHEGDVVIQPSIVDAVDRISSRARSTPEEQVHVLVTGSLYLVGGLLDALKWDVDVDR